MWTGLYPGKTEDRRPHRAHHQRRACSVVAGSANVPSVRPPSGRRTGSSAAAKRNIWEGIENVDDGELWETHLSLKSQLLEFVRRRAVEASGAPRRIARKRCTGSSGCLSPDALTIGFARRFATYKRANLILADIEKLATMVNDPKRPVQFVFAGKAHPLDEPGKRVLQQIAQMMRDSAVRRQIRLRRRLRHQRWPPFRARR